MKKQSDEKPQIETPTMQALIKEIMKERKIFVLERRAPARQAQDLHTSLLVDHVTTTVQRQLDEMSIDAGSVAPHNRPANRATLAASKPKSNCVTTF